MTREQYIAFDAFRNEFKAKITEWNSLAPELLKLQKEAAKDAKTPSYSFETPIVYNRALDEITENDEIKIIVIGDNPGKDEQLLKNNKYLVGQAGKLGEGFFKKNPELGIDFRKNAIILNKTPVHTAKTNQIKYLLKNGSQEIKNLLGHAAYILEGAKRLHNIPSYKIRVEYEDQGDHDHRDQHYHGCLPGY